MKQDVVSYLKELFELSDAEVDEYLADFFISLDDCCEKLKEEKAAPNFQNIRIITHTLIGFCGNMGANDITEKARELNTAAKAADADGCQKAIGELLELHAQYHQ